jgi:hypothetical protein
MADRRLRVLHVQVLPVLVWDDGEEITPGPETQPMVVPLAQLHTVPDAVRISMDQYLKQQAALEEKAKADAAAVTLRRARPRKAAPARKR